MKDLGILIPKSNKPDGGSLFPVNPLSFQVLGQMFFHNLSEFFFQPAEWPSIYQSIQECHYPAAIMNISIKIREVMTPSLKPPSDLLEFG
jgi:hypothetical protein